MSHPAADRHEAEPPEVEYHEVEYRAVRRGVVHRRRAVGRGLPALVAVVGLGGAMIGQVTVVAPAVQDDIARRTVGALDRAGYPQVTVSVDGRDVALAGVPQERLDKVLAVVLDVDGVRRVSSIVLAPR